MNVGMATSLILQGLYQTADYPKAAEENPGWVRIKI
tara:strand:- start:2082 stop:2189 length:108 start_codon:yes stop_codon:yes gene_type:complete